MEITIDYKLLAKAEWLHVTLSAEEYFDLYYLEEDELLEVDSIPKHDHTIDYLEGVSRSEVEIIKLKINDPHSGKSLDFTERFWNAGKNTVIERCDSNNASVEYWELIVVVLVSEIPNVTEILRLGRVSDNITVYHHSFIERLADGTERQSLVYPLGTSD